MLHRRLQGFPGRRGPCKYSVYVRTEKWHSRGRGSNPQQPSPRINSATGTKRNPSIQTQRHGQANTSRAPPRDGARIDTPTIPLLHGSARCRTLCGCSASSRLFRQPSACFRYLQNLLRRKQLGSYQRPVRFDLHYILPANRKKLTSYLDAEFACGVELRFAEDGLQFLDCCLLCNFSHQPRKDLVS